MYGTIGVESLLLSVQSRDDGMRHDLKDVLDAMLVHEHGFNERELRLGKRHVCDGERRAACAFGRERAPTQST